MQSAIIAPTCFSTGRQYLLCERTEGRILLHECKRYMRRLIFALIAWLLHTRESGANAIGIAGVVVVHVTIVVDIPEVGGVSRIRRAQPPIRRYCRIQPINIYRFSSKSQNASYLTFEWRTTTLADSSTINTIH